MNDKQATRLVRHAKTIENELDLCAYNFCNLVHCLNTRKFDEADRHYEYLQRKFAELHRLFNTKIDRVEGDFTVDL